MRVTRVRSGGRSARGGDASGSEDASASGHGVVIIHAHPKFGGAPEMMRALAAELASHGIRVVNLALRGAGASGGSTSWQGDGGEVADVVTAADYARETLRCRYVHLVGYSFGATVAGAAVDARDFISTYVAVAYPLGHWWSRGIFGFGAKLLMHRHTDPLKESVKPKLFVIGTEDDFTSRGATERFARRCCAPWDAACTRTPTTSPSSPTRSCDASGRTSEGSFENIARTSTSARRNRQARPRKKWWRMTCGRTCTQTSCRRKRETRGETLTSGSRETSRPERATPPPMRRSDCRDVPRGLLSSSRRVG